MDLWVIGAGGLLGSALVRTGAGQVRRFDPEPVPWSDPVATSSTLRRQLAAFHAWRRPDAPWGVVWAAGSGVIASSAHQLTLENDVLMGFARELAIQGGRGAFVFASSAAVFGDHGSTWVDETFAADPLNDYTRAKLAQERELTALLTGAIPTVLARISTLYGPGQNLGKSQGLVSSMCNEAIRRGTISVFVPLDTTRDFLFTDDAAHQVLALMRAAQDERPDEPRVRVVASRRSTTVAELARTVQAVSRRRAPILQVKAAAAGLHTRSVSLTSVDPMLRGFAPTPLPIGVAAVHRDVLAAYLRAR